MLPGPSLYISDLDGTLLDRETTLSRYSRDTLNALMDQGLLFTVASARSVASIMMRTASRSI